MRIAVLGASGGTGAQVVSQAAAAGHKVLAVVRDPSSAHGPGGVRVVRADVMDAGSVAAAVAGSDAVVSALGRRRSSPAPVCSASAPALVQAARASGIARLVVTSAAGMHTDGDGPVTRWLLKPVLARVLREEFADMATMEQVVSASDLDWTILRPPMLTNGPHTGRYRSCIGRNVRGGLRLSRADLADAAVRALTDPRTIRTALAVAY